MQRDIRPLSPLFAGVAMALAACASESGSPGRASDQTTPEQTNPERPGATGPSDDWEWSDVPGAECGNGSPTGFAMKRGIGNDVFVYLEGGGFCWDDASCGMGVEGGGSTADRFATGYTEAVFREKGVSKSFFDRRRENNPFRNVTLVYIPYCTGDFHVGSVLGGQSGELHFSGRKNLDLFLARIRAGYPTPSRLTLAGSSAGGFGALFNYEHVTEAFPGTRVDMISDSAPVLRNDALIFNGLAAWNTSAALPEGCPECKPDLRKLYGYYSAKFPNARFALTSFDHDNLMAIGGYALTPDPDFADALGNLATETLAPLPNVKHFFAGGTTHTMFFSADTVSQAPNGGPAMKLGDWVTRMASDDPSWQNQSSLNE